MPSTGTVTIQMDDISEEKLQEAYGIGNFKKIAQKTVKSSVGVRPAAKCGRFLLSLTRVKAQSERQTLRCPSARCHHS